MSYRSVELTGIAKTVVETCAGMRAGETLLLIADLFTDPDVIQAMATAGRAASGKVNIIFRHVPSRPHALPEEPVAMAMKGADVIVDLSRYDIVHTLPMREALFDFGARAVNMTGHTIETLLAPNVAEIDYEAVYAKACQMIKTIERGKVLRYSSPNGTNLTAEIGGRKWYPLAGIAHQPGTFAVIPIGEIIGSAVPGTPNGKVVLDFLALFGKLHTPIVLHVEKGWVTKVEGGEEAEKLRKMWEGVENANYVGELGGIGINPKARLTGRIDAIEEQMKLGSVHIGLGDSLTYGDRVSSKMHLNATFINATVEIDGKAIIAENRILI